MQTALSYSFLNLEPISCFIQGSNCCFLTYIQVSQETGKMVWYFTVCYEPQKGFSIVSEAEVDVFLELAHSQTFYFSDSCILFLEIKDVNFQSCLLLLYNIPFTLRQWHPTPVLLPRKSHGWRSLVGCSPWGR